MPPNTAPEDPSPTRDDVMGWDHHALRSWLQSQVPPVFSEEYNLAAFAACEINGLVFLSEKTAFFQSCGLPLGVARHLALLAEPFSGSSKKRKGEFEGEEPENKKVFSDSSKKYLGMGSSSLH
jgi:hypothetical protein